MFVESNNCREIYNYIFFNNKELPTGNKFERLVYLTLQLFDNPKGNSAYKNIFDMSNENKLVTDNTICVKVTPAQQKLLELLTPAESVDFSKALKEVHYLGTYCVDNCMLELWHHAYVHRLMDALQEISQEFIINDKTA